MGAKQSAQAGVGAASSTAAALPGLQRVGSGEPLVLLHGITGSVNMWRHVLPLLAPHHDVIALTALGHRGGASPAHKPTRIAHVVDDAERCLDQLGFDRVHLAGNSMGGWVALELARRGRALSVCAFSPAGTWPAGSNDAATLRKVVLRARLFRPLMPWLAKSPLARRAALRENACHGERVSPSELLEIIDDLLACTVREDLFSTDEQLLPLRADCPVTIAWSRRDQVLSMAVNGERARALVPEAHYLVLENVGHVPMFDDPQLVASTILASTAPAKSG